jgi:hypothetical protein
MFVKINEFRVKRDKVGRPINPEFLKSTTYDVKSAEFDYGIEQDKSDKNAIVKLKLMFSDDLETCSKLVYDISFNDPTLNTVIYFMNENGKTVDSFEY